MYFYWFVFQAPIPSLFRNPYISMLSTCTVKFSLGTEECSTILHSFCWSLTGIHACEHRTPVVGVQYILHGMCAVFTSAVSVYPWAPLEAGANTSVITFKLLIFTQVQMLTTVCREQRWVDTELRLPIAWVFTIVEIMLCWKPVQHTHWKLKSQEKLMEWERSSNKTIFYNSSGCKVCFWMWNRKAEELFSQHC